MAFCTRGLTFLRGRSSSSSVMKENSSGLVSPTEDITQVKCYHNHSQTSQYKMYCVAWRKQGERKCSVSSSALVYYPGQQCMTHMLWGVHSTLCNLQYSTLGSGSHRKCQLWASRHLKRERVPIAPKMDRTAIHGHIRKYSVQDCTLLNGSLLQRSTYEHSSEQKTCRWHLG